MSLAEQSSKKSQSHIAEDVSNLVDEESYREILPEDNEQFIYVRDKLMDSINDSAMMKVENRKRNKEEDSEED